MRISHQEQKLKKRKASNPERNLFLMGNQLNTNWQMEMIRLYYLNRDSKVEIFILLRRLAIMSTTYLCKTISILKVTLNGSFLEYKIQEKVNLLSLTLLTM